PNRLSISKLLWSFSNSPNASLQVHIRWPSLNLSCNVWSAHVAILGSIEKG
ncbi:9285_t:CDS:1, partial [Funneliformis geosporum]